MLISQHGIWGLKRSLVGSETQCHQKTSFNHHASTRTKSLNWLRTSSWRKAWEWLLNPCKNLLEHHKRHLCTGSSKLMHKPKCWKINVARVPTIGLKTCMATWNALSFKYKEGHWRIPSQAFVVCTDVKAMIISSVSQLLADASFSVLTDVLEGWPAMLFTSETTSLKKE